LKEEDYNEFYKSILTIPKDPMLYMHTQAEGTLDYTTLFFVPKKAPFDLFYADYKPGVKLYVKRIFITDDDKELMPVYLRFVRGIIDSEDLPLNVSGRCFSRTGSSQRSSRAPSKKFSVNSKSFPKTVKNTRVLEGIRKTDEGRTVSGLREQGNAS
jgi:molecular chaperone HtpG